MDLATVIGLVMGYLFILGAILYGGSLLIFIDVPSILVVVGGTASALLYAHPMPAMKAFVAFVKNAFQDRLTAPEDVTAQIQALAQKVRKEDLLSLENEVINDPFMARAVRLAVDGVPVDTIRQTLGDELSQMKKRHEMAADMLNFGGAIAPAMGMIGTLIGLVQMLQNLDDPSTIGPSMAVALLTTFYGAVMANMFFIPVCEKLKIRSGEEAKTMQLIIEGIDSIVRGENVMITKEKLEAFLSPLERAGGKKDGE